MATSWPIDGAVSTSGDYLPPRASGARLPRLRQLVVGERDEIGARCQLGDAVERDPLGEVGGAADLEGAELAAGDGGLEEQAHGLERPAGPALTVVREVVHGYGSTDLHPVARLLV